MAIATSVSCRPCPRVVDTLAAVAREGDLVITLGAGSIGGIGPKLLARLREEGT